MFSLRNLVFVVLIGYVLALFAPALNEETGFSPKGKTLAFPSPGAGDVKTAPPSPEGGRGPGGVLTSPPTNARACLEPLRVRAERGGYVTIFEPTPDLDGGQLEVYAPGGLLVGRWVGEYPALCRALEGFGGEQ